MALISNEEFVLLIEKYKINMYRLALGILHQEADAEDAVSEAVINAYEHLYSLKAVSKFKPWIMQITANESKKLYRKSKRVDCVEDMETLQIFHQDEHHELWDVVMRLEVAYREVIILYFYDQI